MADVSKRLAGPTAGTGAAATLYTAPATPSQPTIVRHIQVANTTTTDQTFKLSIGADAAGTRLYSDTLVKGNGGLLNWNGFLVLNASEAIQWTAPTTLTVTISGVEQ